MGGEKLNPFRFILAFLLLVAGTNNTLFTQDLDSSAIPNQETVVSDVQNGESTRPQTDESLMFFDEDDSPIAQISTGPSNVFLVLRMVLVLALAAGAIYGVLVFIRRMSRPSVIEDPNLKVLSSVHLGSNRYVHVVSLGSKAFLLGASDGSVSLIKEIDDKEIVDAMLLDDSRKGAGGKTLDFRQFFERLRRGNRAIGEPVLPSSDFVKRRRERFKGFQA